MTGDQETSKTKKPPLSQAPGIDKLMIGVPAAILCGALAHLGYFVGFTRMFAVIAGAYALVGAIEVLGGESLAASAKKWDRLPGWKKFLISIVVILAFFVLVIVLIPIVIK